MYTGCFTRERKVILLAETTNIARKKKHVQAAEVDVGKPAKISAHTHTTYKCTHKPVIMGLCSI